MKTYLIEASESEVAGIGERRWARKNYRKWIVGISAAFMVCIMGIIINTMFSKSAGNVVALVGVGAFMVIYYLFMKRITEAGKAFLKEIQSK